VGPRAAGRVSPPPPRLLTATVTGSLDAIPGKQVVVPGHAYRGLNQIIRAAAVPLLNPYASGHIVELLLAYHKLAVEIEPRLGLARKQDQPGVQGVGIFAEVS